MPRPFNETGELLKERPVPFNQSELEYVRDQQDQARETIIAAVHPRQDMAWLGFADWMAEEVLMLLEAGPKEWRR